MCVRACACAQLAAHLALHWPTLKQQQPLTCWLKILTATTAAPTSPATSSTAEVTMSPMIQGGALATSLSLGAGGLLLMLAAGAGARPVLCAADRDMGGLAMTPIVLSGGEVSLATRTD